jgi:hypothetical protein
MNFKAFGKMRSNPTFNAKVKMDPLQFETSANASCECEVGRISAHIGEVGIRFAIPFMKPRRKLPLVASVGGFHIRLRPFQIGIKGIGLHVAGVLGTKGSSGEVDAKVGCETEMEVEGKFPIKVGRINLDLCDAADLVE